MAIPLRWTGIIYVARDPSNLLSLAAISFPLIALVVTFAIDAVGDGDSIPYRGVVGGLSIAAITSGALAVVIALYGYYHDLHLLRVVWYVGISFSLTGLLSIGVVMVEILRGVEGNSDAIRIFGIIVVAVVLLELIFNTVGL